MATKMVGRKCETKYLYGEIDNCWRMLIHPRFIPAGSLEKWHLLVLKHLRSMRYDVERLLRIEILEINVRCTATYTQCIVHEYKLAYEGG